MDTKILGQTIEAALQAGIWHVSPPHTIQADTDSERIWNMTRVGGIPGAVELVVAVLKSDNELSRLEGVFAHGVGKVSLAAIAQWALAEARRSDPMTAADKIIKFAALTEINAMAVLALTGLMLERRISLTRDITLLPFEELPLSIQKDAFSQVGASFHSSHRVQSATAALATSFKISPVFYSKPETVRPTRKEMETNFERFKILQNIAHCLVLVGPCPVFQMGTWIQMADERVPPTSSGFWQPSMVAPSSPHFMLPRPLDVGEAVAIVNQFVNCPLPLQASLGIPLERLGRSLWQPSLADRAIDLGVAIEAVLGHDLEPGEILYKISRRGAWLLPGALEDRIDRSRLIVNVYALRSKAVHTGSIRHLEKKLAGPNKNTAQILEGGARLCSLLIKEVVKLGRWPNWEEIVFGGAP